MDEVRYLPSEMAAAILAIPGGGGGGGSVPEGTLSITANGSYNVSGYAGAEVRVAGPAINGTVPEEYQSYVTRARALVLQEYPDAELTGLTLVLDGAVLWILFHEPGFEIGDAGRNGLGKMLSSAKGFYETIVSVKTSEFGTIDGNTVAHFPATRNVYLQIRTIVYSTIVWEKYGVLIYPQNNYDVIGGGEITYTYDSESMTLILYAEPAASDGAEPANAGG